MPKILPSIFERVGRWSVETILILAGGLLVLKILQVMLFAGMLYFKILGLGES